MSDDLTELCNKLTARIAARLPKGVDVQPERLTHAILGTVVLEIAKRESRAERAEAAVQQHEDLLAAVALYIGWRYVTRQLTTPQKELFADAIERHTTRVHGPDGEDPEPGAVGLPSYAPRWWRDPEPSSLNQGTETASTWTEEKT